MGHTQWDTVNCTYRGYKQPVREGHTRVLSTEHTDGNVNQLGRGRLGTGGTDNHTDRVHTQWGTLGHCQLYIGAEITDNHRIWACGLAVSE